MSTKRATAWLASIVVISTLTAGCAATTKSTSSSAHHHQSQVTQAPVPSVTPTPSIPPMSPDVQAADSADLLTFEELPKVKQLEWMLYQMQVGDATDYERRYQSVTGNTDDAPPNPAKLSDVTSDPQNIIEECDLEARFAYTLVGDERTKFIVASLMGGASSRFYNQHSHELRDKDGTYPDTPTSPGTAAIVNLVPASVPVKVGSLQRNSLGYYLTMSEEQENNNLQYGSADIYFVTVPTSDGPVGVWILE